MGVKNTGHENTDHCLHFYQSFSNFLHEYSVFGSYLPLQVPYLFSLSNSLEVLFQRRKITPDYCKINQDHLGREMIGPKTVTLLKGHSVKLPSKYSPYSQTSTTLHLRQRRLFMKQMAVNINSQ